jgi:hypothetical protein
MLRQIGPLELLVIFLILSLGWLVAIPFCLISKRLGYPSLWGLITILPFGVFVWACYVAIKRWPNELSPGARRSA